MTARAGIVVTGTEVLTGRVTDRNGPWLAEQLRALGVDVGHVVVVGDRPDDMRAALAFLAGTGVALVDHLGRSGADGRRPHRRGRREFQGRPSAVDPALEQRIAAVVERLMARRGWRADPEATAAGVRQAGAGPAGATVLEPVGTAPGLVVPPAEGRSGPTVLVLPGPPAELQGMWPAAVAAEPVQRGAGGRATELRQETVRLWGTLEAAAGRRRSASTTPSWPGWRSPPACGTANWRSSPATRRTRSPPTTGSVRCSPSDFGDTAVLRPGPTLDDVVADGLADRGLTVATAESCTGGLLAARLTARPGSSAWVLGGVTAYATRPRSSCSACRRHLLARARGGQPRGGGRPRRRRAVAVRCRRRGGHHRRRRAGRRAPRTSRSARCTCAWPARTAG